MEKVSVLFRCAPESAFRYLVEPRNRPEWQSSLRGVVDIDPGEPHQGMGWRDVTVVGLRPRLELTQLDPFRSWSETGTWRSVSAELTLHFVAVPEGTRVEATMSVSIFRSPSTSLSMSGRGWERVASKVVGRMAPRVIAADLARAAAILEV